MAILWLKAKSSLLCYAWHANSNGYQHSEGSHPSGTESSKIVWLHKNRRFLRKRHSRVGKRSSADDVKASQSDLASVPASSTRGKKGVPKGAPFFLYTLRSTDTPTNVALQYWESVTSSRNLLGLETQKVPFASGTQKTDDNSYPKNVVHIFLFGT